MNQDSLNELLKSENNDNPVTRAEIARDLVKAIYDFVKFHRSEGGGLDGRDGPERQSLADLVDAAEDHYTRMLEEKHLNSR